MELDRVHKMHGRVGSIYSVADLVVDPLPQPVATSTLLGGRYLSILVFVRQRLPNVFHACFGPQPLKGKFHILV